MSPRENGDLVDDSLKINLMTYLIVSNLSLISGISLSKTKHTGLGILIMTLRL